MNLTSAIPNLHTTAGGNSETAVTTSPASNNTNQAVANTQPLTITTAGNSLLQHATAVELQQHGGGGNLVVDQHQHIVQQQHVTGLSIFNSKEDFKTKNLFLEILVLSFSALVNKKDYTPWLRIQFLPF